MLKRIFYLVLMTSILISSTCNAGTLERLKSGYGYVIIAVENGSPSVGRPIGRSPIGVYSNGLRVIQFDPLTKTPSQGQNVFRVPEEAQFFEIKDESNGNRYWIGQMRESDAAIVMFHMYYVWGLCFNSETRHFSIKANEFNLLGSFDARPSIQTLQSSSRDGQIPSSADSRVTLPPIINEKLKGFTPASDQPNLKVELDLFLTKYLRRQVSSVITETYLTNYNLGKGKRGQVACMNNQY